MNDTKIAQKEKKMKIIMTRINSKNKSSDSQIAVSKEGKIVFMRMCIINR